MKYAILKREPGFYWALLDGKLVVAEWYHGCWRLSGQSRLVPTDEFDEVPSKRVPEPTEEEEVLYDSNGIQVKPHLISDCCKDGNFINAVRYDDTKQQHGVFFCTSCKKETTVSEFQQLSLFVQ